MARYRESPLVTMHLGVVGIAICRAFVLTIICACTSPVCAEQRDQLLALAHSQFPSLELTECEKNLLEHLSSGDLVYCGAAHNRDDPVPNAEGPRKKDDVDAGLIRWLLLDSKASKLIDPRGLRLVAARVIGQLDLSEASVPVPVTFVNCRFAQVLDVHNARLPQLILDGSWTPGLEGYGLRVEGNVSLRNHFYSASEVSLLGADIGGTFDAGDSSFINPNGNSVFADGMKVGGAVFLGDGFESAGTASLIGVRIGGNLEADGGTFVHPDGYALIVSGGHVEGSVFLRNNFHSEGEVLFTSHIGGSLEADAATFKNEGGDALSAGGAEIGGSVYLRNGFRVEAGNVNLVAADIKGDLVVDKASFAAVTMFLAQRARVKGEFNWSNIEVQSGGRVGLDLTQAIVGPLFDDAESWPGQGDLSLDGFVYERFVSGSPMDADSRLRWLDLQPAKVASQPYEQLAKALQENGDNEGRKRVLIAMETRRYRRAGWPARLWGWVLNVTIGYGYEPFRALWFIAAFVILGTCLFSWGHSAGVITPIASEQQAQHYKPFNSFVYSLETFLPLVELHQARHWLPDPELRPESVTIIKPLTNYLPFKRLAGYRHQFGPNFAKHLRWYLWLHIMAGWFFASMLIAGITGLVQKG
jgi:hypothetical protein